MENLDPLRQKPDFEKAASEFTFTAMLDGDDEETARLSFMDGCEHVWTSHVEPLMKQLEILKSNDRDKFAIGFAEWMMQNRWYNTSTNQDGLTLYYQQYTHPSMNRVLKTLSNLLELYKESLLNQKP